MIQITDTISHSLLGDTYRYWVFFRGDEYLLNATNKDDAIIEGAKVIKEMEEYAKNS